MEREKQVFNKINNKIYFLNHIMKKEGFWQMKFMLHISHILKKVCIVKVAMSIFTAKTKNFHLLIPKIIYLQFNSISFAQLFQTNKYSTMFTVISKVNEGKTLKERTHNILVSKSAIFDDLWNNRG